MRRVALQAGQALDPGSLHTQLFTLTNPGPCPWDGVALALQSGPDNASFPFVHPKGDVDVLGPVVVGASVTVGVTFEAPPQVRPTPYTRVYRLRQPDGEWACGVMVY